MVIFILWLYGTMNIVFVGAEINVVLRNLQSTATTTGVRMNIIRTNIMASCWGRGGL